MLNMPLPVVNGSQAASACLYRHQRCFVLLLGTFASGVWGFGLDMRQWGCRLGFLLIDGVTLAFSCYTLCRSNMSSQCEHFTWEVAFLVQART